MLLLGVIFITFAAQNAGYPAYAVPKLQGVTVPGLPPITGRIHVDQFGYLPQEEKVAVISDPQKGYNAADSYQPGATLEVRDRKTKKVVASGAPKTWKGGAVHEDSGDKGWWFDFSAVKTPGEYYIFDPKAGRRSAIFEVRESVFAPILKAASRMFYYQRLNTPIEEPYAQKPWIEAPAYPQDAKTRSVTAKEDANTERDMRGGWMDAGDTNKYPPFNYEVIHPLLYAYRANPKTFGDANNIPESGNGLPDLLDELKVQLDWMVKMQFEDGSVPVKMGVIDYNGTWPISNDKRPRYYGPKDTGAAIVVAGYFANAARVYAGFPKWKAFADDLKRRAILSWNWYQKTPKTEKSDTGEIKSGIANRSAEDQLMAEAIAAVHLFALTKEAKYNESVIKNAPKTRQLAEPFWSPYGTTASEALVDYLSLPGADAALCRRIKDQLKKSALSDQWAPPASADLYRAWMAPSCYHWGSNAIRANQGHMALMAARYADVSAADRARLRQRALDMLHSFHGVNPLTLVYLSNMGQYGAELSCKYLYHERWGVGSPHSGNPAPGYVVGGANQQFSGTQQEGQPSVQWLKQQPRAKAYADFDKAWPEAGWELSEPAIYYQAMYIRLLSEFVGKGR